MPTKKGGSRLRSSKRRNWAFTDFEMLDWAKIYADNSDFIRYIGWGLEVCPKTKRQHFQGWIQFNSQKRMSSVKLLAQSKKIHLEPCMGSEEQNNKYCSKDGIFKCCGSYKSQGARSDIETIVKMIKSGATMETVADQNPQYFIQYHNGLSKLKKMADKKTRSKFRRVETILLTGPTGCGKTRTAMEDAGYKITGGSLEWWDGYDGEETILIDEYSNDVKITTLLNLLDGYQLRLPIKGGFTYANWTKVYITTNLRDLHSNASEEHRNALARRITTTTSFWKSGAQSTPISNTDIMGVIAID